MLVNKKNKKKGVRGAGSVRSQNDHLRVGVKQIISKIAFVSEM